MLKSITQRFAGSRVLLHRPALVFAAAAALSSLPAAATNPTYTDGDVVIGFRSATSDFDYIIDLGSAAKFMPTTINIGYSTGADVGKGKVTLVSGASFLTDLNNAGLSSGIFSVFGSDNTNTNLPSLFGSRTETIAGHQSTTQAPPGASTYNTPYTEIQAMGNQFSRGADTQHGSNPSQSLGSTANSVLQHITADANTNTVPAGTSYSYFTSPGTAFGYFTGPYEGSYSAGSNSQVVDLYEYDATASQPVLLGALQVTANNSVVFDSNVSDFTAAPEPSAAVACVFGGAFLCLRRRRRLARTWAAA